MTVNSTEISRQGLLLYPAEKYIVIQVARDLFEGNESQAIRHMIREYAKRNLAVPEGGQVPLVDTRAPYQAQTKE